MSNMKSKGNKPKKGHFDPLPVICRDCGRNISKLDSAGQYFHKQAHRLYNMLIKK